MPNWTLKQLEAFVWVAKLRSFRRTADRLHTTQPNISVRINGLEEALGARLFERQGNNVTLTPFGQTILSHAERVLLTAEELSARSGRAGEQSGILRLGVTELVAHTWLRHYLKTLKQEFPNVGVELTVDLSINLRKDLVERSLDLCLLNGPISDFNIANLELGSAPFVWIRSPNLPLDAGGLAGLARQTILTHARHTRPFVETAAHFRDNWHEAVRIVTSSSLAACLQMAIDGLGVAALSQPLVEPYVASGELVLVPYEWTPSPLVFSASYAHSPPSMLLKRAAEIASEVTPHKKTLSQAMITNNST